MPEAGRNPLLASFEHALERLNAVALAGNEDKVVLGYQELELNCGWAELQGLLLGERPAGWADAMADYMLELAARARADDDAWDEVQPRILPVLLETEGARRLESRAPDVLAYESPGGLLITLAVVARTGLRYVLQPQLDAWRQRGGPVLAAALENLRRETPAETVQEIGDHLYSLDTGDGLDASRLLILDELHPAGRAGGLLAVAPARENLTFVPFNRGGVQHLRALVNLATEVRGSWPHPLTDTLYYRAPSITLTIGVSRDAQGHPKLTFPEQLAELQARLVAEGQW